MVQSTLVYFIRHGEKPKFKSSELSLQGNERAQCISNQFSHIKQIIAQKPDWEHKSKRPIETVVPLSIKLGIPITTDCTSLEIDCVQRLIEMGNGPILVVWEHKRLMEIASRFANVPKYPKHEYDLIFVVDTETKSVKVQHQHCSL